MTENPHDFIADCAEAEMSLVETMAKMRQSIAESKLKFREISIEEFLDNNAYCIFNGYVAQESNGNWFWYKSKPEPDLQYLTWNLPEPEWSILDAFNIKKESDWTRLFMKSKMENGEK